MAKKNAKAKKAKAAKKTVKRSVKRPATKSKARKAKPKTRAIRAAKVKVAARAAASRKETPAPETSALKTAAKVGVGLALLAYDEVVKRLPWAKNENDPIALLESDHRRFERLLKEGEATTDRAKKGRREILTTLTSELNVHEALEEKILYPALQPLAEAHDIVLEGVQEHHVADVLVKELHVVATDDEQWGAKFKVLKESIEHHIGEEEHKMFPAARGALKKDDLLALGKKMRELKAELEK